MAITGYVTEQEIVDFMELINEDFTVNDISEVVVNAMYQVINSKMDTVYDEVTKSIYVDGTGDRFIFCPQIPMKNITKIAIVELNGEEVGFIINGLNRNIWWDENTGKVWTDREYFGIEYNGDRAPFPNRPVSVRIDGTFGTVSTELVKQLQLMLILKQYSLMQPSVYASDIISEKIGRYEYKLVNASNVEPSNQRKGVDGWIAFLFECLPSEDTLGMESI